MSTQVTITLTDDVYQKADSPEEDIRLSELLARQQAGILTDGDRSELQLLMQTYQEGLLRKATALSEAVKRKLIQPLSE